MSTKLKLKKGDTVKVIAGADKGKEGRILSISRKNEKVVIEGVKIVSKHTKPNAQNPDGGIVKQEAPIHISNVMLIDPKLGEPTKVYREVEDGKIVRKSRKSGEIIK